MFHGTVDITLNRTIFYFPKKAPFEKFDTVLVRLCLFKNGWPEFRYTYTGVNNNLENLSNNFLLVRLLPFVLDVLRKGIRYNLVNK